MRFVLYVLAIVALLFGLLVVLAARGAIHEILGGVSFVCFAVFLTGGAVCSHLDRLERATRESAAPPARWLMGDQK